MRSATHSDFAYPTILNGDNSSQICAVALWPNGNGGTSGGVAFHAFVEAVFPELAVERGAADAEGPGNA
jgi:hypothetical protein